MYMYVLNTIKLWVNFYSGYQWHATYSIEKSQIKLRFGGRQSKKSRWNYFEFWQDS